MDYNVVYNNCKKFILFHLLFISLFLNKKNLSFNENVKNYIDNNRGYKKSKFAILRRLNCPSCGLFSDFVIHLGCINKYLELGYIPIIDLSSFENIFNGFQLNSSDDKEFLSVNIIIFHLKSFILTQQ